MYSYVFFIKKILNSTVANIKSTLKDNYNYSHFDSVVCDQAVHYLETGSTQVSFQEI